MSDLILFPGNGSADSIETIFVDGYRFDICEVKPDFYEYLAPSGKFKQPAERFFVEVENKHIINYAHAERLHLIGVKNRWDIFCTGKSVVKRYITMFETYLADYKRMTELLDTNPKFTYSLQPKIDFLKSSVLEVYGIKL